MKKVLITMALLVGLSAFAQHKGHIGSKRGKKELTAEQVATLKTKKMALALDLSKKQQEQLMVLNLENAKFRRTKLAERKVQKGEIERTKPSADEKFAMLNERLDRQLAQQEKLKQILNDNQYQQWKKLNYEKHKYGKKRIARNRRG